MEKMYLVLFVSDHSNVLDVSTDDFEEVKEVVKQWMWDFSDGHIWVCKKTTDGDKVIKHIILQA